MEALLAAILDAVFASLAESVGLSDWLRDRLRRDPEKLAFCLALTQALTDTGAEFPGRDVRYFAEILRDIGGPLLARTLQPASPFPTATELTQLWLNHLTIDSAIHYREDFTAFATLLLDQLNQHIENQQPLQWVVQARRQRSSEEVTRRLAEAAVQSTATLDALRQGVAQLTGALETALKTGGSTVTTAGGAYVAGSVSAHHFAGRDLTIKNYFVAGLARLPTDYSVRIENFLFTYLGGADERVPFGGRQQQLDELNHWVDDPTAPPYYLMVAEAGKGKSALVCRWSAQLATRADLAVIFVPISIRFQTAAQDVFFGVLAARLAQLHEKQAPEFFHKTNTATDWKAECESYLRRPLPDGKRLVVIVDGLDEATDWLAGPELFAVRPPAGLRVLVTARLRARESDALGWAATLNWEGPRLARKVTLPALDRQGVEEALASMGNPLDWLATQIDIVGKLYYLSEGDPLLVRLYVDELDKKKAQAAFLTPADLDTIQPGLAGFMQKWWEDQRKQWRMQNKDPHAEEERLLPLLSACAVAYGPLLLKDLAALDATHFGATRAVVNRAELLARWLIGDGERQGYVFAHPRLREFFSGPTWLSDEEHAAWQAKFCDWGERVLAALNAGKLEPKQASEYLLRNYATHLAQNAAPPERFYALISDWWRKAWEELDVSYGGFLNDVERAWVQATQSYDPTKVGKGVALAQQIKAALCKASVTALSINLPPELLAQAVHVGLHTPVQALAIAKLATTDGQRASMLNSLAPHLPAVLLGEALTAARSIKHEGSRADTLVSLAPHLPAVLLGEALTAARSIDDAASRANALVSLAPYLPAALLGEALTAACSIEDEPDRANVLGSLAPYLPAALLGEALTAARSIKEGSYRVWALGSLAPHLSTEQGQVVLGEALTAAHSIKDEASRANTLITLALRLSTEQRQLVLGEALTAACSIQIEFFRADALNSLAPHLESWCQDVPMPAANAWLEILPILATNRRPTFLHNLTALMPFILALTGDEAPEAAAGIFHAIQEVCAWWP